MQTIYDLLKKQARQAGVRQCSPHDLRRTFVSDMLDRGVDTTRRESCLLPINRVSHQNDVT